MKIIKIESARIIVANNGRCLGLKGEVEAIECNRCFNGWNQDKCKDFTEDKILALAEAYIKRNESKSKKKDHILDTTKKVEEPKPIKTVGIDNSDVTLAQHEPTVKENLSVPQPVKFEDEVPEYVYWLEENRIIRKRVVVFVQKRYKSGKTDTFALVEGGQEPYLKNLYRTPEEALQVAKKLWNGEGK